MEKIELNEIYKVFKRQGLSEDFEEQSPLLVWMEICSAQMGRLTQPLRVKQGILYIEAANHVVAQQLNLLKDPYLKKINHALGGEKIRDLRFRVGSRGFHNPAVLTEDLADESDLLEQNELRELLENVDDPRMKSIFERLIKTNLRWDRIRSQMKANDKDYIPCAVCGLYHEGPSPICYYCDLERE